MSIVVTTLLIIACILVMVDAWTTRKALLNSKTEGNRVRSFMVRTLGLNGGTFGVSAVFCSALIYSYFSTATDPTKIVSYGMVVAIYSMIVKSNWEKTK